MENPLRILRSFQIRKRWIFLVGLLAITHFLCQSLMLPYGNALRSLLPKNERLRHGKGSLLSHATYVQSVTVSNPIVVDESHSVDTTMFVGMVKHANKYSSDVSISRNRSLDNEFFLGMKDLEDGSGLVEDKKQEDEDDDDDNDNDEFPAEVFVGEDEFENSEIDSNKENKSLLENESGRRDGLPQLQIVEPSVTISEKENKTTHNFSLKNILEISSGVLAKEDVEADAIVMPGKTEAVKAAVQTPPATLFQADSSADVASLGNSMSNVSVVLGSAVLGKVSGGEVHLADDTHLQLQSKLAISNVSSIGSNSTFKKQMRCNMPPKTVMTNQEMNNVLLRHRRSSRAMRPRWTSPRDQEIMAAKLQIENAPVANSAELYAPLFRNVSMFKRSYEIMERTLKVYIYKEGEKPIFHQPILKGLYASEGWFMKLMEGNQQYSVKDPRKAHLFYMPFSTRMLEHNLYVRNSHNRTNLRLYLKQYAEHIAAKYKFWNRTGGADHILVACHDWAPYETRHHMEHCIKALCNADVTAGFKIGRDVSLPETYVRSAKNPLRDLGGKPPSKRHILAFYAGNMHGYLRVDLLKYWKDKDQDMKIFGPMPPGVASKMNYIEHMKSSKFCICPKGYEVNSPRVVEAIFYECVPVIISDNFVPPFFEVLDWGAFSLILAEKDIPKLKDILGSISERRYLEMQLAVRKVQKHFLWHAKPLKYDLFHMTLHSIWYNRVFQMKLR